MFESTSTPCIRCCTITYTEKFINFQMSLRHLIFISIYLFLGRTDGQVTPNPIGSPLNTRDLASYTIAESDECKVDVQKYCIKKGLSRLANSRVLKCVDDLDNAVNLISKDCQSLIYRYKYNLTHDISFDNAAKRFCQVDLARLEECSQLTKQKRVGHLVSCLYDALPNITEISCRNFIQQIQVITFTDWRLSEYFADACMSDITKHKCGRLDDENDKLPHDQGFVLACLSKHSTGLTTNCSKEISRMIELQSNDYHLDRSLYTACRSDRQRLCATVTSGNGQIYRCLYEQKFNSLMSPTCREEIHRRQKIVVSNALIDAPLIKACKTESVEHRCISNQTTTDKKLSLIDFFLCLEDQMKIDKNFNADCKNEMLIHRRMLMTDYKLSPEILSECNHDILSNCAKYKQQGINEALENRGGKMIHCLLNSARLYRNTSENCLNAVKKLVVAINPATDIRADPILEGACQPVISTLCSNIKAGDGKVVLCLLENLRNTRMTEDCRDRLLDVAYFMQRDWRITPSFARLCQKNLVDYCSFPKNWSMTGILPNYRIGTYLTCLHDKRAKLDRECQEAFKRLMFIRSQSMNLMPEIEDDCINDLATCEKKDVRGEEMKCLQDKYHDLEDDCKKAVRTHTKMTMADPTLDFYLMKACEPIIQSSCTANDLESESRVLQCLIKQKNNPKMDFKCKTSINHHQITSLKDKAFLSSQFQERCTTEIQQHCSSKKTKAEMIQCLADFLITDVLKNTNQIAKLCREELKFELLQRGETIELDPLLMKACDTDMKRLCKNIQPGNAQVLECLKKNLLNTTGQCQTRLLKRAKLDVALPSADFSLTSKCNVPIQKFCSSEKQNLLLCLIRKMKSERFPSECQTIVYQRVMILNTDARFNKGLIDSCGDDIQKFCEHVVVDDSMEDEDEETEPGQMALKDPDLGGRIIGCLRDKYANSGSQLTLKCVTEVVDLIELSKIDISFDVQLYKKCHGILQAICPGDDKEDCLKLLYQRNQIADASCKQEVIRIIREGQADVHIDSALSFACQADVNKFCQDTPAGNGRQLLCLLNNKKSVSENCKAILLKREELWRKIPNAETLNDLSWHVVSSPNRHYLFIIIGVILLAFFLCGCVCRPWVRYSRVSKYK